MEPICQMSHESCHWYMWLPAYVTTIWYSSHHRCAECTRAGIAKYIHPYVVPCQWSVPGCRLDGSVVDMQLACLLCAGIFWPFSGSLSNKDTLIQLEPDQATPLLTRSYWRDILVRNLLRTFLHCIGALNSVIGRVWRADTKQSWVFISARCFLNWKLRWSSVWAIN